MKKKDDSHVQYHWSISLRVSLALLLISLHRIHCQNDFFDETAQLWPNDAQDQSMQSSPSHEMSNTRLTSLDVICGKEYMTVRAEFNSPFKGIVFSKGTYGQNKCVYVKAHSGLTHVTFNVRYDECGTKPDLQGKYFENTIVIQYGTDIIEALDEAKRLRCEWFEAYEKPATFRPAIPVADLDIIEMNFQGDEIDCWMSIQEGKGPWSSEINRIVTVGQPLSIVVAINDYKNQFDMKVKSCFAHDGIKPPIYLIDEDGCVLRSKMISPFKKIRNPNGKASLISYAQFLAFKFPDSVDVQIQCTVEVCRHGCSNTCDSDRSSLGQDSGVLPDERSQNKPSHNNEVNRFLVENADLLESASAHETVSVNVPANVHSVDVAQHSELPLLKNPSVEHRPSHNQSSQAELSNIAAFVHTVEPGPKEVIASKPMPNAAQLKASAPVPTASVMQSKPSSRLPMKMPLPPHKILTMPAHSGPFQRGPAMASPIQEPVAQVLNIPLSPMYMPGKQAAMPNLLSPFSGFKLLKNNKKSPFIPQLLSNYFGKNRQSQFVPNDNFEIVSKPVSPNGQRFYRTKRFVSDKQGEIGLKRGFQVVTSLDLSFAPNMSADQMPVYEGIPAPIVYGMCFSTSHVFYFLGVSLLLLAVGICSCVYIICRLERTKQRHSHH